MSEAARKLATAADLAGLPGDRSEVVAGALVEKAAPTFEHGSAQVALGSILFGAFGGGGPGPAGWWFAAEVEVEFENHEVYLPDVAGWRRDRVSHRPQGRPIRTRPDWVCEILSSSTASRDTVQKYRTLHRCGVPHYWVVDPDHETLTVHRWQADGYLVALVATTGETVRAEPFETIDLRLGLPFGQ